MKRQKKHFLILSVLFAQLLTLAVANKAHCQFLNKDATWTVLRTGINSESYREYSIWKDSTINDTVYSLFTHNRLLFALREDSNRVYYKLLKGTLPGYDTLKNHEHVLYDFNLTEGDSIYLYLPFNSPKYSTDYVVQEVDSILIGNTLKKRMYLEITPTHLNYGSGEQYWIEDIGSLSGPLYLIGISEHEVFFELYCYRLNNEKLYGDCLINSIRANNTREFISVKHIPLINQLEIELPPNEHNGVITIYSLSGRKILMQTLQHKSYINLDNLDGRIIIAVVNTDSGWLSKKINIQKN